MNWVADRDLRDTMEHERNERIVTEKYRGAFIVMSLVAIFQIGVLQFVAHWTPIPGLTSQPAAAGAETAISLTRGDEGRVTRANYDRLQTGMSCSDACRTVGSAGQELARCRFNGAPGLMEPIETVVHAWINADGSSVNVTFQNDRLISKGQSRLREATAEE
jgi:hypothetical protein